MRTGGALAIGVTGLPTAKSTFTNLVVVTLGVKHPAMSRFVVNGSVER